MWNVGGGLSEPGDSPYIMYGLSSLNNDTKYFYVRWRYMEYLRKLYCRWCYTEWFSKVSE